MTTAAKIETAIAVGLEAYEKAVPRSAEAASSIADSVGTLVVALSIMHEGSDGDAILRKRTQATSSTGTYGRKRGN